MNISFQCSLDTILMALHEFGHRVVRWRRLLQRRIFQICSLDQILFQIFIIQAHIYKHSHRIVCQSPRNMNRAHYYLVKNMHFQQTPDIDHHHESLEEIGVHKEDHLDKTSHQLISYYSHQQQNPLQPSPLKGSFFFTPNSPKHFQFDIHNQGDKKQAQAPTSMPPISKKINFQMEEEESHFEEKEQQVLASSCKSSKKSGPNRSSKNSKGLRNLSESVYRIVSQLKITRYKEVADRLVREISATEPSENLVNKDEHNIKRRVYDALNVLISAGILRKQGKQVACNEPFQSKKSSGRKILNTRQYYERIQLEDHLREKAELLKQKQEKLRKLDEKRKVIEYIIRRNRNEEPNESRILRFPLISTIVKQNQYSFIQGEDNSIFLSTWEQPPLYGDVDMLVQINRDLLEANKLLDSVCQDVKIEESSVKKEVKVENLA